MEIKYLGHSAFLIDEILIDPFISGNPLSPVNKDEIKCKAICVTHGHIDHLGDAIEISKRNDAPIIAIFEIAQYCESQGAKTISINIGGEVEIDDVKITQVEAVHSSTILLSKEEFYPGGIASGFIISKKGKKVYHAGDTSLFPGMEFIGRKKLDVALLPIGGVYTMDVEQALEACKLLKPKVVIPMHYNTFPLIKANPEDLKRKATCKVIILKPGETYRLEE